MNQNRYKKKKTLSEGAPDHRDHLLRRCVQYLTSSSRVFTRDHPFFSAQSCQSDREIRTQRETQSGPRRECLGIHNGSANPVPADRRCLPNLQQASTWLYVASLLTRRTTTC